MSETQVASASKALPTIYADPATLWAHIREARETA